LERHASIGLAWPHTQWHSPGDEEGRLRAVENAVPALAAGISELAGALDDVVRQLNRRAA
jgi:hypothetical protein